MKLFWRMMLVALLALQVIATPVHAFAQELGHTQTRSGHHTSHDHDHPHDALHDDAADSHDHGCMAHCHAQVALLNHSASDPKITHAAIFSDSIVAYSEKFTEPIERPQWFAARV